VHPTLAAELAALIVADPDGTRLGARLAREPLSLPKDAIVELAARAVRTRATVEQTALALGLLSVLPPSDRGAVAR